MGIRAIVIGGGVIGLSIARQLRMEGIRDITVIDRGAIGREASWAAAGMLAPNAETEEQDSFYRFCAESNGLYPTFAAELADETGIDIEFRPDGTLELAFDETNVGRLTEKYRRQSLAGVEALSLSREQVLELEPKVAPGVLMGLYYPADGQVDNRRVLDALVRYAELNGIRIESGVEALEITAENGRVTGVSTTAGQHSAGTVVLATGAWASHIKLGSASAPFEVRPVRGQMLSVSGEPGAIKHVIYGAGAYLVPRRDGRILIGATVEDAGFDRSVTDEAIACLHGAACDTVGYIRGLQIADRWAGLRPGTPDGRPILGTLPGLEGVVVATGHYRNGILLAPLTAALVSGYLVSGVRPAYFDTFAPDRFAAGNAAGAF